MTRLTGCLILIVAVTFGGGCTLRGVQGEIGGVEVEAENRDEKHSGNGDFCPPGQAKKGNC